MDDNTEREARLPIWAQEALRKLRRDLLNATGNAEETEAENARLRQLVEGKYAKTDCGDSDTFLEDDDTAAELPLGKGVSVRFADFYTVRYGAEETTGGARALIIETDDPMAIRPTFQPDRIIIGRA